MKQNERGSYAWQGMRFWWTRQWREFAAWSANSQRGAADFKPLKP